MSHNHPGQLFAVRRHVPLLIGLTRASDGSVSYMVASDSSALPQSVSEIIYLQDGELAVLSAEGLRLLSSAGTPITCIAQPYAPDTEQADRGPYGHYMLKEIHEQPSVIRRMLQDWDGNGAIKIALANARRLVILGCGTSLNAGLIGRHLFESLCGLPVMVESASEFRYRKPALQPGDLAILLSQSGETADTLAALRLAKAHGLTTLALTNRPASSLAREADLTLPLAARMETSVAATKSFTAQVLALTLLALDLRNTPLQQELALLPMQIEQILADPAPYRAIAENYATAASAFFIARGINAPTAAEAALKLKEVSYIHAEGYPAGELKHGPLALLDDKLPVFALLADGPTFEKTLSNCQEAQARGAPIIAFTNRPLEPAITALFAAQIRVPAGPEALSPILMAVATQLLAYYMALRLGRDIDQPRNIAKSVTVE